MRFLNPIGLSSLFLLILLIIIYLRRPKPLKKNIPSLMFIMKDKGRSSNRILKNIFRNLLFFLQFLAIGMLCLSIADPEMLLTAKDSLSTTVWVIDASASSKAVDGQATRFSKIIEYARDNVAFRNSIVLINEVPVVISENKGSGATRDLLDSISPLDLETNIGDSIMRASTVLGNRKGRIMVLSDFVETKGTDALISKRSLEAKGIPVEFVKFGEEAVNIGIVELAIAKDEVGAFIKNFNDKTVSVDVAYQQDERTIKEASLSIQPRSRQKVTFSSVRGISTIAILTKDDFTADNIAYISNPEHKPIRILYITNKESPFVKMAFSSIDNTNIEVADPPIIPQGSYDIYYVGEVQQDLVLPGTFEDIREKVRKGATLIFEAQPALWETEIQSILPVIVKEKIDGETSVKPELPGALLTDIVFGSVSGYFKTELKKDSTLIASAGNGSAIIAAKKEGAGNIVYYGVSDTVSDFKFSPSYPIFWNRIIESLLNIQSIDEFNFKTGKVLAIENQKVNAPGGRTFTTSKLFLDAAGIYELDGKKIAANLLSEKESELNNLMESEKVLAMEAKVRSTQAQNIQIFLIAFAAALIIVELIIIKFRGDI
ncbi:BatA and WFA domain-containing protein [Candidatus Woesearchaeota archaeon]|nr:BatA and WFA domain-containing protein [Candidatus Woesearchaeota archaeon]